MLFSKKEDIKKSSFKFNFHNKLIKKKNKAYIKSLLNLKTNKTELKKKKKILKKTINYIYKKKKIKKNIFLKKPNIFEIYYPFFINIKLVKESI